MFILRCFVSIIFLIITLGIPAVAEDNLPVLKVLVHNNPGKTYLNEDGVVVGNIADEVRQFLDQTGLKYEFKLLPWVRVYREATTKTNSVVVSLLRTRKGNLNFTGYTF